MKKSKVTDYAALSEYNQEMSQSNTSREKSGTVPELNQVNKDAKIRNQNNQVPHLTQDTNGKVTNSQLDTPNESQEVSRFPAGEHKAQINRRAQRHNKHMTERT